MKDYRTVAMMHLIDGRTCLVVPWSTLAGIFLFNVVITMAVTPDDGNGVGGVGMMPGFLLVMGILMIGKWFPFAAMLGITRRRFYLATLMTVTGIGLVWSLALTGLCYAEKASNGWGIGLRFFRVPYAFDGPWYLSVWVATTGLVAAASVGFFLGAIYLRFGWAGIIITLASAFVVATAGSLVASSRQAWPAIGNELAHTSVAAFGWMLAAVAVLLGGAGLAAARKAAV